MAIPHNMSFTNATFTAHVKEKVRNTSHFIPAYNDSNRITLNISGKRFETFERTLEHFPKTLLGSASERNKYFNPNTDEYYFLRDSKVFDAILFYYQSRGILAKPDDVDEKGFYNELAFFKIISEPTEDDVVYEDDEEATLRSRLWLLFDNPNSSMAARFLAMWSVLVIFISTTVYCVETLPMFRMSDNFCSDGKNISSHTNCPRRSMSFNYWMMIEGLCVCWFLIEFIVRFFSTEERIKIVCSMNGLIDLIAIIPFFVMLVTAKHAKTMTIIRLVKAARIFRVFKISRYYQTMQVFFLTLSSCVGQLKSLFFCYLILIFLYSSAMYYAEFSDNTSSDSFVSIPASMYYCIITTTTVGYGDMVPVTVWGRLIGVSCLLNGILILCLPIPLLVSSFFKYAHEYGFNVPSGSYM